jgi:hypothetical protein
LGRLGQDGANAIAAFARSANGGLIVTGTPSVTVHRNLIVTLAAQHRLPAVYYYRSFVTAGGLSRKVGMSKTSILRSIKSGRISTGRDEFGNWAIEPCELHWVCPALIDDNDTGN